MKGGTTSYRAPELIKEQPLFTRKADIWAIGCIFYELVTGKKAFLSDCQVREYEISKSELDIPNVDYHYGASNGFLVFRLRETLKKSSSRRPSAHELLGSFQNFDVYLFYFEHQASRVRKIDVDINDVDSTVELAPEPSANLSDAIEEVEGSKECGLTLDDVYQRIRAIYQETELNESKIRENEVERNEHERQLQVHMQTRKRQRGNSIYSSIWRLKCNACQKLKRKVLRWLC